MDPARGSRQRLLQKLSEEGLEEGRKEIQAKEEEVGVRWLALALKLAWREHTVPFTETH